MLQNIIRNLFGKKDFNLDDSVPFSYLLRLCFVYLFALLRGTCSKLFFEASGHHIFIEKKVELINKKKISVGNNVRIEQGSTINAISTDGIVLGDNVKIGKNNQLLVTGSLQKIGKGIKIGANTSFSENTFFGASGGIEVGENVISGQNVRFHAENHLFSKKDILIREQGVTQKGIKIGNNCWIGSGVVFLDGTIVGDGCVIAANAVLNKNYPSNSIIAGVPAKVIKTR